LVALPLAAFWLLCAPFFWVGLLRRNVRALFRNSGSVFSNSGFYVCHGGESFLRLVGA
jgi:hypothetical protein